jgi:SAM-dependent methyltransferase
MSGYTEFAYIYDALIEEDYEAWANYIERAFRRFGRGVRLVLDLGCGTGNLTTALARRGYDLIGLDASADMLAVAANKTDGSAVRYICQDMTRFELYGTVDAIVCTLDCVNYVTDAAALARMFRLARNYLNPGGLFLFDVNSEYKISKILGNNSFVYDCGDIFYTWENIYNTKSKICAYQLTFFVKSGENYHRIDERQKQKAYSEKRLRRVVEASGMTVEGVFDGLTFDAPGAESERLMFICKKN